MDRKDVKKAAEVGDIKTLAECSQSRDNRLRQAALKALGRLGTSEAADAISATALTAYDPVVQADATGALSKLDDLRFVPAERRSRWLRGELDEEPGTTAPHEGSVLPDQSDYVLEVVAPPPGAAPTDKAHKLMITSGDRQRAGEAVELVLSIPGWPDRKVCLLYTSPSPRD